MIFAIYTPPITFLISKPAAQPVTSTLCNPSTWLDTTGSTSYHCPRSREHIHELFNDNPKNEPTFNPISKSSRYQSIYEKCGYKSGSYHPSYLRKHQSLD